MPSTRKSTNSSIVCLFFLFSFFLFFFFSFFFLFLFYSFPLLAIFLIPSFTTKKQFNSCRFCGSQLEQDHHSWQHRSFLNELKDLKPTKKAMSKRKRGKRKEKSSSNESSSSGVGGDDGSKSGDNSSSSSSFSSSSSSSESSPPKNETKEKFESSLREQKRCLVKVCVNGVSTPCQAEDRSLFPLDFSFVLSIQVLFCFFEFFFGFLNFLFCFLFFFFVHLLSFV